MPIIEANGIEIAYEAEGDPSGEVVLLIAGLGLQLTSWPDNFRKQLVNQGFRVLSFDNRDSGLSTKMDEFGKPGSHLAFYQSLFRMPFFSSYTLYDMAKDAVGLLDALRIKKAHVVGASMGGMIAQILAARHRERVLSLTSIMSTSGRPGLPGPTLVAQNAVFSPGENTRDIHRIVDQQVQMMRVFGSPAYPTPDHVLRRRVLDSVRRNVCRRGTARQMMAVASSGDRVALLNTIRVPTLVVHGSDDPLVPIACGRDCANLVPGALFHEVEGMGHDIPPALETVLANLVAAHCQGTLVAVEKSA